jgi:GNAT superfamily N-acetyltransferase
MRRIVTTVERPDLAPVVAAWLWESFARARGRSFEETLETVLASVTASSMPRTFVLLIDDRPVGTASLTAQDLEERPDLTPWLADVFVEPGSRRQGLAARLIAAVEDECRKTGIATLWLYTRTAENVYTRAGWRKVETVARNSKSYALMRREL